MFAVVLVVEHGLRGRKAAIEQRAPRNAPLAARAIGPAAPAEIGFGEVAIVLPDALVDRRLQPGAIGPRHRPEHPVKRPPLAVFFGVGGDVRGQRVDVRRLVERRDGGDRAVEQIDQAGERIAEEAGDAQRHIDPRPVEHRDRQHLEPGHPAARALPDRPHAEKRQRLGDVVAAGAHIGRAPSRHRDPRRIAPVILRIALDDQPRRMPAELPRRRRRHGARIDGKEIPPGREDVRASPTRGAGRTGCDAAAVEPGEDRGGLCGAAGGDARAEGLLDPGEDGLGPGPGRIGHFLARHQPQRKRFQPLDRVADRAPCAFPSPPIGGEGGARCEATGG